MDLGIFQIDDYLTFYCNTHNPKTGAVTDAADPPVYRIYEDEAYMGITASMALLDAADTDGYYSEQIQLTYAAGFEENKTYSIRATASVQNVVGAIDFSFRIRAAQPVEVSGLSDGAKAEVNAEVADALGDFGTATTTNVSNAQTAIVAEIDANESKIDALNNLSAQEVRDAMKLPPTGNSPAEGSVDKHLDDIEADTDELQSNQGNWLTASGFSTPENVNTARDAIIAEVDENEAKIDSIIARVGDFVGTGMNTIKGFFQALFRSDDGVAGANQPSGINEEVNGETGTYDAAIHSLEANANILVKGSPLEVQANDGVVIYGTVISGDYEDTWIADQPVNVYILAPVAVNGLDIYLEFTLSAEGLPQRMHFGSAHFDAGPNRYCTIYAKNWETLAWELISSEATRMNHDADYGEYIYPLLSHHKHPSTHKVQVRIYSPSVNTGDRLYIDECCVYTVLTGLTPGQIAEAVYNILEPDMKKLTGNVISFDLAQSAGYNYIILAAAEPEDNRVFKGNTVTIVEGTGVGQSRCIISYNGVSKTAYVDREWAIIPDSTSLYAVTSNVEPILAHFGSVISSTSDTITLPDFLTSGDGAFEGAVLYISGGLGEGQIRLVNSWNGTDKIATISVPWEVPPDSTSFFKMFPWGRVVAIEVIDKEGYGLADAAITEDKYDQSTAFPLAQADSGNTAVARTGGDSDTLETLSDQVDALKTHGDGAWATADVSGLQTSSQAATDKSDIITQIDANETKINTLTSNLATTDGKVDAIQVQTGQMVFVGSDIKATLDGEVVSVGEVEANVKKVNGNSVSSVNDFKADVSGLATSIALASADTKIDGVSSKADTIQSKTDNLPEDPADASVIAGRFNTVDSAISSVSGKQDTTNARLTDARAGYIDNLNVPGTLANTDNANTFKADVSALSTTSQLTTHDADLKVLIAAIDPATVDDIMAAVIDGDLDLRATLKLLLALGPAKGIVANANVMTFKDQAGATIATITKEGDITSVVLS